MNENIFKKTWEKFQTLKDKQLSFTDCTSIAFIEANKIKHIISFDSNFDGLTPRIY